MSATGHLPQHGHHAGQPCEGRGVFWQLLGRVFVPLPHELGGLVGDGVVLGVVEVAGRLIPACHASSAFLLGSSGWRSARSGYFSRAWSWVVISTAASMLVRPWR